MAQVGNSQKGKTSASSENGGNSENGGIGISGNLFSPGLGLDLGLEKSASSTKVRIAKRENCASEESGNMRKQRKCANSGNNENHVSGYEMFRGNQGLGLQLGFCVSVEFLNEKKTFRRKCAKSGNNKTADPWKPRIGETPGLSLHLGLGVHLIMGLALHLVCL